MRVLAALAIAAAGVLAAPAAAHGPCGCLDPRLAEAGRSVRIAGGQPAYRVVFNPRPRELGIAPAHLASAHRADVATTTVLDRPRRRPIRRARLRVPAGTPPGVYLVLIFDGGEGGAHSTWEYLHVVEPADRSGRGVIAWRADAPERDDGLSARAMLAGSAATAVAAGIALAVILRRRRRR